jgi:hypothetical protein
MSLLRNYFSLLSDGWGRAFRQKRTAARAVEHAVATSCCLGRRPVSRCIAALGRAGQDWSADYKFYSRSAWSAQALFEPAMGAFLDRYPEGFIPVAMDDTRLSKTGRKIPGAAWQRDPLSPPFHTNLIWGVRHLQASIPFPLHREGDYDARSVPVRFDPAPPVKKPGKRADTETWERYRKEKKERNLSRQGLDMMRSVRAQFDALGAAARVLLWILDGSFCNRTIYKADLERAQLLARCRKDARLCFPAPPGQRRKYQEETFTPEQVRQDESIPWKTAKVFVAGAWRDVRYKEADGVLWRRGAGKRPLRLIVLARAPYKLTLHGRTCFGEPAYVLTTDRTSAAGEMIQAYCDRWQIEVNHRDEKDIQGVGDAQVRSHLSVARQPSLRVAAYSLMLLAALQTHGPERTAAYLPLPKWRKHARRPSILDIVSLIRWELQTLPANETRDCDSLRANLRENLVKYAYT